MLNALYKRYKTYSREKVAKYGTNSTLFALFVSLDCLFTFIIHASSDYLGYHWVLVIKIIGMGLSLWLVLRPFWLPNIRGSFPLYWYFTLCYCLPFSNTISAFLLELPNPVAVVHIALSSVLLIVLVDWATFIMLSLWGLLLGIVAYELLIGNIFTIPKLQTFSFLIYMHLCAICINLAFARTRQQRFENAIKSSQLIGGAIGHEVRNAFNIVLMAIQLITRRLEKVTLQNAAITDGQEGNVVDQELYALLKNMLPKAEEASLKGIKTVDMLLGVLRSHSGLHSRKVKLLSMRACTESILEEYDFEEGQREKLKVDLNEDFQAQIVSEYYKHVLLNLLSNIYAHADTNTIRIWFKDRKVYIRDEGIGIAAEHQAHVFDLFYTKGRVGTGIGLALCKYIMEALGGSITCRSQQGKQSFTEFTLHFPLIKGQ